MLICGCVCNVTQPASRKGTIQPSVLLWLDRAQWEAAYCGVGLLFAALIPVYSVRESLVGNSTKESPLLLFVSRTKVDPPNPDLAEGLENPNLYEVNTSASTVSIAAHIPPLLKAEKSRSRLGT